MTTIDYRAASALLVQFYEWLDTDGFGVPNPLLRSQSEMVRDFLAGRNARTFPQVTDVPQAVAS